LPSVEIVPLAEVWYDGFLAGRRAPSATASAGDAGRDEAFVHDQRIRRAVFTAEGVVADEARLILYS